MTSFEFLVNRIRNMLVYDLSKKDIVNGLYGSYTMDEIFLAYVAAQMLGE